MQVTLSIYDAIVIFLINMIVALLSWYIPWIISYKEKQNSALKRIREHPHYKEESDVEKENKTHSENSNSGYVDGYESGYNDGYCEHLEGMPHRFESPNEENK